MTRSLEGRTAVITGANQGLGLAIAEAYVRAGANLVLCARDGERLEAARTHLAGLADGGQQLVARAADVSRREDVERLIQEAVSAAGRVHVLVNNAGIYGPLGLLEENDWAAWVKAVEINLLGPVLLCRALLPHFKQHGYGKIIQLSGGGATNPLPRISAYAASKAAVVRFAETLAEEVRGTGIDVNAVAPGALNTRMLDEVLAVGPATVGRSFYEQAVRQKTEGGASLERAAALAVFLGSPASDGITGKLLSAVWDPWEELAGRRDELSRSDVYTLRRIVPGDRGLTWGDR